MRIRRLMAYWYFTLRRYCERDFQIIKIRKSTGETLPRAEFARQSGIRFYAENENSPSQFRKCVSRKNAYASPRAARGEASTANLSPYGLRVLFRPTTVDWAFGAENPEIRRAISEPKCIPALVWGRISAPSWKRMCAPQRKCICAKTGSAVAIRKENALPQTAAREDSTAKISSSGLRYCILSAPIQTGLRWRVNPETFRRTPNLKFILRQSEKCVLAQNRKCDFALKRRGTPAHR